jgi:hypothetical protein
MKSIGMDQGGFTLTNLKSGTSIIFEAPPGAPNTTVNVCVEISTQRSNNKPFQYKGKPERPMLETATGYVAQELGDMKQQIEGILAFLAPQMVAFEFGEKWSVDLSNAELAKLISTVKAVQGFVAWLTLQLKDRLKLEERIQTLAPKFAPHNLLQEGIVSYTGLTSKSLDVGVNNYNSINSLYYGPEDSDLMAFNAFIPDPSCITSKLQSNVKVCSYFYCR